MKFGALSGFRLVTTDAGRLSAFYAALGFSVGEVAPIPRAEMDLLGLAGRGSRLSLALGPSRLDLDSFDHPGQSYPEDANAADLIFQHLALVTDDAAIAWERARAAGAIAISRACPVTLPASSGGVTAVKFRDPDGHPLELLQLPAGAGTDWSGSGILGIDHSAISVSDIAASRAFYAGNGLRKGDATLNRGQAQETLDGLDNVEVDVVPMIPTTATPHVELLGYRHPTAWSHQDLAANDIAATRIVWAADEDALWRDPDGHLHQLRR